MLGQIQIVIDCRDPHRLNDFWSETIGYQKEDHHDLVGQLVDSGQLPEEMTILLDGRRAFRDAAACVDPDGKGPRLLFQVVPEDKQVKNRVHLDLQMGERRDEIVTGCLARGATKLWDGQQGPTNWVTLADPEGNEFCVSG